MQPKCIVEVEIIMYYPTQLNTCFLCWQYCCAWNNCSVASERHFSFWKMILAMRKADIHSYSQADTLLIFAVFSVQGWRFWSANKELLCRQMGSGVTGWFIVFWKASCWSCIKIRFACCRSASLSSAVCRLDRRNLSYTETEFGIRTCRTGTVRQHRS